MKKKILLIALLIIIIFGVFYQFLNSSNNGSNSSNNHTFSLNTVALTLDDIDGNYTLVNEKYFTEPGEFKNSTGDGRIWKYTEHYQSQFIENISTGPISANDPINKILQTITKLESREKADLCIDLWTDGHQQIEGYLNIPTEKIGNKSSYFSFKTPYEDYEIDNYVLCFSIEDIFVTVGGSGLTVNQSMYLDFAKIIESNILNSM